MRIFVGSTIFSTPEGAQLFYNLFQNFTETTTDSSLMIKAVGTEVIKFIEAYKRGEFVTQLKGAPEFAHALGRSIGSEFVSRLESGGVLVRQLESLGSKLVEPIVRSGVTETVNQIALQLPKLGIGAAVAAGITVAGGLSSYYLVKRWFEQPKLIDEERRLTGISSFTQKAADRIGLAWGKTGGKIISIPPVFNEDISRKVKDFTKGIAHLRKTGGYFQNALFYGPGGVGKTMICDKIAEDANVNFIKMSGGKLAQCIKRGDHVTELNRLFDYIESSSLPTVLFIDEAEALCGKRSTMESAERLELIDAFLHRTGTPSKKIILLMATNRTQDLDPAALSRMDYKFRIDPPALPERIRMISDYVPKFFSGNDRALFTPDRIKWMAEKIENATGRAIFKLLNTMNTKKEGVGRGLFSWSVIEQTVQDWIAEESDLANTLQSLEN